MDKNCLVCGRVFKTYPSKIKLGRGKYCSKACSQEITNKALTRNGVKSRFTKGQVPHNYTGKSITARGYIEIYSPKHPNRTNRGYVKEHRLIIEKHIGRYLNRDEYVHHINEDKQDNRIENLQIVSHKEHMIIHGSLARRRWSVSRKEVMPNAHYAK